MSIKIKYLTDSKIRSLPIQNKEALFVCSPKLYVRAHPNGSKYFEYRYTFHKKQRTKRIGVYGSITLAQARATVEEYNGLVRKNIAPSLPSKITTSTDSSYTMIQMLDDYFLTKQHLKPTEHAKLKNMVNNHILKHVGQLAVTSVDFKTLNKVFMGIVDKPETFRKCKQHLIAAYKNAIRHGDCSENIAYLIDFPQKRIPRENYPHLLSKDLPELFTAIESYRSINPLYMLALKLQILTALRPSELRTLKQSDINFQKKEIVIPAAKMKMGKPHIVPLTKQMVVLFKAALRLTGVNEFVFPNRQLGKPMSDGTLAHVIEHIGYKGKVSPHGFRHSFSTIMHEKGYDTQHIEIQLAHVDSNAIRGTYNHAMYYEPRVKLMQDYSDYMCGQLGLIVP